MDKKINLVEMYMGEDIKEVANSVLDSKRFIKGGENEKLGEEFSKYANADYGVTVSSGTAALFLALKAIGIKKGDEVITVSHSFIATAATVVHNQGNLKFLDVDEESYCMDVNQIEELINKNTKAIIPVHLYGHAVDMDSLMNIAKEKELFVIEDACQAHGAEYNGKKVGSIGDVGCFSFFPSKNMTVCGDGGIAVINNEELAEKISMLRDQGRKDKYLHEIIGYNFRMSELAAAIGRVELKHLEEWTKSRRKNTEKYNELLREVEQIILPIEKEYAKHVYHMYVIRSKERRRLAEFLKEKGIETGIHYPIPIHKQPCFKEYNGLHLPVTEKIVTEILSLPMSPLLKESEVEYVCKSIKEFYSK